MHQPSGTHTFFRSHIPAMLRPQHAPAVWHPHILPLTHSSDAPSSACTSLSGTHSSAHTFQQCSVLSMHQPFWHTLFRSYIPAMHQPFWHTLFRSYIPAMLRPQQRTSCLAYNSASAHTPPAMLRHKQRTSPIAPRCPAPPLAAVVVLPQCLFHH
jgi:hypothetical protein